MNEAFYAWTVLSVYIVIGVVVAAMARKKLGTGMNEFFLANRQLGGIVSALTYAATTYSAFMMVGLAGLTYKLGVGALGYELTYLCGLVLVVFFGPRFWLVGHKYDYLTHAELLADRYQNRAVGIIATVLCLVFLIPYAAIQLMGIGYLLSVVSKGAISLITAMAIATLLAIVWSYMAGLRSVAWTDALQVVIMMVTSVVTLFFVVYKGFGGIEPFFNRMNTEIPELLAGSGLFRFNVFFGLALPWLFFSLSNPQVTQRLFVPKSVTAFKQMIGGFLIFGLIYTLVSVLWGFSARLLLPDLASADLATPSLLALAIIPKLIAIIVMVGILSAAISTIDSILLTLSSMCSRDLVKNGFKAKISEETELKIGKRIIPILAAIFFVFAYWAAGKTGLAFMIAPLSSAASAGLLMAVPSIIGAFFWKKATAAGALTSMIGGAALVLILQLTGLKPLGLWPGVWGVIVCTGLYICVSLVTRAPIEKAEEFIGYLEKDLPRYKFI
ncbi:MAG: sodium:solute symporter family protein [Desulfobacterales bacterium]|nr:sodium:solute symporter family protein [Desulfobacterales bacterium]MDD4072573.1 sodium:solute symporter family protein [Desulfobacterales bacterium]MDD4393863.1 sodium:solute symporter family protein [Desulfobacterales bacterium]